MRAQKMVAFARCSAFDGVMLLDVPKLYCFGPHGKLTLVDKFFDGRGNFGSGTVAMDAIMVCSLVCHNTSCLNI